MIARPASPQVQAAAAAGSIARSIRLGEPNWPNLPQMPPTQLLPKRRGQLAPTYAFARHLAIGVGMDGQRPCRTLAEDPGRTQPRAAYPRAAAQTRVVSLAGIRLGSWESARARLVSPAQASLPRSWPTPELRIPNAAAQTRIVSKARIRLDSCKSVRSFKGIICVDISEFESYMPSHAVRSLRVMSGLQKYTPDAGF